MAKPFPTTLADLNYFRKNDIDDDDEDDNTTISHPTLYRSLRDLRKATLSIPNRLRSILQDAEFVQRVVLDELPHDRGSQLPFPLPPPLPLIANERCGSWYIPPHLKAGSAYFKSTDGHFGQWDFSLRRLNLPVLTLVGRHGGAVLVDSTRRGKSVPDAFAKTVPIWVTVMNRVLFPEVRRSHGFQRPESEEGFVGGLGESEVAQIEARLDGFVEAVKGLGLDVGRLRGEVGRPMRVFWRVNDSTMRIGRAARREGVNRETSVVDDDDYADDCHPLILCSASRRVLGAEMSEGTYIQGAGDDSEGWSRGLTPALFWEHKEELLRTPESELEGLIRKLVVEARSNDNNNNKAMMVVAVAPTSNLYIAKAAEVYDYSMLGQGEQNARISLDKGQEKEKYGRETETEFDVVIDCNNKTGKPTTAGTMLELACRTGKLGSRDLGKKFELVRSMVQTRLQHDPAASILVTCETGKDLCVGVALVLLCLFYDDRGHVMRAVDRHIPCCCGGEANSGNDGRSLASARIDKTFIRRRLAWIVSSYPDARPSRATLQSVNAFLIERPG